MAERLMAKLDRLGAEAGIKQMTPEIYKFSMLVRADTVEQWPQREWVGLTEEDFSAINQSCFTKLQAATSAESILKEKNNG